MDIGKFPVGTAYVLDRPDWSERSTRRNIRAMIGELRSKVHVAVASVCVMPLFGFTDSCGCTLVLIPDLSLCTRSLAAKAVFELVQELIKRD